MSIELQTVQIVIEGPGAEIAAKNLFAQDEIEGHYQISEELTKESTIAIVGTIVAICVGSITVGEKLFGWYKSYRMKDQQQRIEKVLVITPECRFLLEDASLEDINNALKPFLK